MRAARAPRRLALALPLAAALSAAAPCAAQEVAAGGSSGSERPSAEGRAALDETKIIQGIYVSLSGAETMAREGSAFGAIDDYFAPRAFDPWKLSSSAYSTYSLSFKARGVSGQVSAWAQADASHDLSGAVSQAWIKATFGEGWGLAFGRRELAWKDGGYWNPSDVVNYRLTWDQKGEARGRDSIELIGLLPFMDFNLDVSAATAFQAGIDDLEELPLYLAAGSILYPFEIRAKAALQADRRPILGAALKLSLTGVDLYGDLAWLFDHPLSREIDPSFAGEAGSWLRFCVGGTWSADISRSKLAKSLGLRLEYLRQDDGLSAAQGELYLDGLSSAVAAAASTSLPADWASAAISAQRWDGRFFALYRDYAVLAIDVGEIANAHLSLSASGLINLDDWSTVLRGSLSWSPKNLMAISLSGTGYLGPEGSEAKALPKAFDCSLTLSKSF